MARLRGLVGDTEHGMFVRIERDRFAMRRKIQIERFKVTERALRRHKQQLHQRTVRTCDKDKDGDRRHLNQRR